MSQFLFQKESFWRRYVRLTSEQNKNGVSATLLSPRFRLASWRILADLSHSNPFDRNLGSCAEFYNWFLNNFKGFLSGLVKE